MESLEKRESLKEALAWVLVIIQFANTTYVNFDFFSEMRVFQIPAIAIRRG